MCRRGNWTFGSEPQVAAVVTAHKQAPSELTSRKSKHCRLRLLEQLIQVPAASSAMPRCLRATDVPYHPRTVLQQLSGRVGLLIEA